MHLWAGLIIEASMTSVLAMCTCGYIAGGCSKAWLGFWNWWNLFITQSCSELQVLGYAQIMHSFRAGAWAINSMIVKCPPLVWRLWLLDLTYWKCCSWVSCSRLWHVSVSRFPKFRNYFNCLSRCWIWYIVIELFNIFLVLFTLNNLGFTERSVDSTHSLVLLI